MFDRRFLDSVLDSSMWLIDGGLLGVIVWSSVVFAPTAIGRWF